MQCGLAGVTPWGDLTVRPAQGRMMDAVVKIYCVHTEPNYSLPWQVRGAPPAPMPKSPCRTASHTSSSPVSYVTACLTLLGAAVCCQGNTG